MESGTYALETVTRLLERLAYRVNAAVHNQGEEPIHDLRVAVRRFTQALTVFKPLYHAKELKKMRRRLKDLMELSNGIRDCDVAAELLGKTDLPGAAKLKHSLAAKRKESVRMLLPALRAWSSRRTTSKWRTALTPNGSSQTPLADIVAARLPHIGRKFLDDADRASSPSELHQARIHGKKLRYSLELIGAAYPHQFDGVVERMKKLQTLLGNAHDAHAVRVLVDDLGGDAAVEAWLKKRERKKAREFHAAWKIEAAPLRDALRPLKHPARKPAGRSAVSRPKPALKTQTA